MPKKISDLPGDDKHELAPLGLAGGVYQSHGHAAIQFDTGLLRFHTDTIPKESVARTISHALQGDLSIVIIM